MRAVRAARLPEVTIVGGGPAGVAAAVWARRVGFAATVVEARDRLGGALWQWSEPVMDVPGWRGEPAGLAAEYERQLEELGVRVLRGCRAVGLAPGRLLTERGPLPFERLVLATGTRPRRPDLPLPPPPEPPFAGRFYAVIGGGDGAASAAIHLRDAGADVVVLHRGRLRMQPRFRAGLACRRARVVGCRRDADGWRLGLEGGGELRVDGVVARLGYDPEAEWTGLPLVAGRVRADRWGRTAWAGVYAVGDVSSRTPSPRSSVCNAYAQAMYALKHLALHPGAGGQPASG